MTVRSDGPVRVLVLVKGLGLGGAERLIAGQVTAGAPGVEFSVAFVRPDKQHFVPELEAAGVTCTVLAGTGRPWPLALARHLRSARPQVVHAHSPLPAAVARVLVALGFAGRGARTAYTEHNRWSAYRWPTRIVNALTMPLDRTIWAVSDEAKGSVHPGRLRRRVQPLHHGVDLEATRAAAAAEPTPPVAVDPGDTVFVHIANRRPEKAHEVLIDAFDRVVPELPGARLWLVGQRLDDPALVAHLAAATSAERIDVLGYRSDGPSLIARAQAVVLSSDHEGLPVVVMEALALGRPVVSTSVGGVPEAVRDGVEGLLVPPRDPAALAAAMVRLGSDPELAERLAAGAARRAEAFDAAPAQQAQAAAYLDR